MIYCVSYLSFACVLARTRVETCASNGANVSAFSPLMRQTLIASNARDEAEKEDKELSRDYKSEQQHYSRAQIARIRRGTEHGRNETEQPFPFAFRVDFIFAAARLTTERRRRRRHLQSRSRKRERRKGKEKANVASKRKNRVHSRPGEILLQETRARRRGTGETRFN